VASAGLRFAQKRFAASTEKHLDGILNVHEKKMGSRTTFAAPVFILKDALHAILTETMI
jgi:hypothetical protein